MVKGEQVGEQQSRGLCSLLIPSEVEIFASMFVDPAFFRGVCTTCLSIKNTNIIFEHPPSQPGDKRFHPDTMKQEIKRISYPKVMRRRAFGGMIEQNLVRLART